MKEEDIGIKEINITLKSKNSNYNDSDNNNNNKLQSIKKIEIDLSNNLEGNDKNNKNDKNDKNIYLKDIEKLKKYLSEHFEINEKIIKIS